MILHGIAASEAIDSAGEKISLKGMDITDFLEGQGFANYEHKSGMSSSALDIIGKVIFAKKIFSEKDCDTKAQLFFWEKVKLPFLFVRVRLFDDAGHEGAKAVAAIIKDAVQNKEPIRLGFSIEGSILKRDDEDNKHILSSLAKQVAITIKPCNASAVLDVDTGSENVKKSQTVSGYDNDFAVEDLEKAVPVDEELVSLKRKIIDSILSYEIGTSFEKHAKDTIPELSAEQLGSVILAVKQPKNEELQDLLKKFEICISIKDTEIKEPTECFLVFDGENEHKIYAQGGQFLYDGRPLDPESIAVMLEDPNVRVKKMKTQDMAKSELLQKDDGEKAATKPHVETVSEKAASEPKAAPGEKVPSLEHALNHVRDAVKAGHLHPDVAHMLTQHLYAHPLVPTVGNKKAYEDFMAKKPKGGAWVHMDGASFGQINKDHGHHVGDEAIKMMGHSARAAADHVAPKGARVWFPGDDEAVVHLPSIEHAHAFVHKMNEHLSSHAPIGGTHKLAMNMGIGENPESAEKALISAKKEKKAANAHVSQQKSNAHFYDGSSSIKKII